MHQGEVGLSLAFGRLGLLEVVGLAQMLVIELVLERGVSCLGEHALLFQDGEDAHGLFNELNASSQVHPKVNEFPFNAFLLVLLLFQHEHVVVEELLQFLIGEVDAQLLKAVEIKDLKASDVQDTNEVLPGLLGIQLLVDANNHPQEHLLIDSLCQSTN